MRVVPVLIAALLAPGAWAGDASGFDPVAIDRCVDAAATQGAAGDCASAGIEACLSYAAAHYKGDDADFPQANCIDASHQAWEARLSSVYRALMAAERPFGIKPSEMLRQAEYGWIAFRDDVCNQRMEAVNARGGNGDLARAVCMRDETARHWARLNAILQEDGPK